LSAIRAISPIPRQEPVAPVAYRLQKVAVTDGLAKTAMIAVVASRDISAKSGRVLPIGYPDCARTNPVRATQPMGAIKIMRGLRSVARGWQRFPESGLPLFPSLHC
jgi:hypothetical protein